MDQSIVGWKIIYNKVLREYLVAPLYESDNIEGYKKMGNYHANRVRAYRNSIILQDVITNKTKTCR